MVASGAITDVAGVRVGQTHDLEVTTGCTAIVFEDGARAGWAPPGFATGTRKADVFRDTHLNETIHGLMLAGGSDYGLDAGGGAMRRLEERRIGFDVGVTVVPIVPTAILFDLGIAVSTGQKQSDVDPNHIAAFAQDALTGAIRRAVTEATSLGGVPSAAEMPS